MKLTFFLLIAALSMKGVAFDQNHSVWTEVLKRYQDTEGFLHYKTLKTDVATPAHPFNKYLGELGTIKKAEFDTWNRETQMSFLINAYNAFTVKLILDNYPVKGIKSTVGFLKSPWKKEFFSLLDGTLKTLDPIEHEILRPKYQDARVHAAVNCASISCPRLFHEAFVGARLNVQLETAFKNFLTDNTRNRYEPETGKLYLSKIFDWFSDDFKPHGGTLKAVEKWGPPEAAKALANGGKVEFLTYNWDLNEARVSAVTTTIQTN